MIKFNINKNNTKFIKTIYIKFFLEKNNFKSDILKINNKKIISINKTLRFIAKFPIIIDPGKKRINKK